ncbi:hypothetical protein BsWGS_15729 [Bradybaena similaris]
MTQGVKTFLAGLGMLKYHEMFTIKGFDDESDIPYLTAFDLKNTIMVANQSDISTILAHARSFRPSSEHAVNAWLCSNSLGYYFISFIQSELTDLRKIAQLSLPNEELYDELEIVLPGHRKRLERAVQRLKLEQVNNAAAETPVSYGWWGKPECLPQAKFDFLCVKASLFSSHDSQNFATVDFMIDSGSDVSTVQEDTLRKLNLQLIGPVYSCGIHGGNHTNLYKGRLKLGDQQLDIEVMGSNYDSLGSRVVRHFRHVIDGQRHIWLKGNYTDPCSAIIPIEYPITSSPSSQIQHKKQKQSLLPIVGVDGIDAEIVNPNTDHVARISDTVGVSVSSETSQECPKIQSGISDTVSTEHLHCLDPRQSTSDVERLSSQLNSISAMEVASLGKMSLSSAHSLLSSSNIPPYCGKHTRTGSKRKQNIKPGLVSSPQKRKHNYLKCSLRKESLQSSSHSPEEKPSSPAESHSESLDNPSRRDVPPNERVSPNNERMSLCNILPQSLRDTDDDIDHLEGSVKISLPSRIHDPKLSANNSTGAFEYLDVESMAWQDRYSNGPCDESIPSYQTADSGARYSGYDIVHINGLSVESMEHDSDSSSNSVETNGDRIEPNVSFIPAYNSIRVIHLDDET